MKKTEILAFYNFLLPHISLDFEMTRKQICHDKTQTTVLTLIYLDTYPSSERLREIGIE